MQLQVVKDCLQAASVPEEGVQHFEQHWTLTGSQRASGAKEGQIDWTFYSPDTGRKVQSVSGLVKIFTSRWLGASTCCFSGSAVTLCKAWAWAMPAAAGWEP